MKREILGIIENLDGIDKEIRDELKAQKIDKGAVVSVAKIIPNGNSFRIEIRHTGKKGKNIVLNANNVALYKSFGEDDFKVYFPEINEMEKGE